MEMSESVSQQERLQAIAEKRKRQTEIENKKRQLEDDRRQLQHLKSKALRERWLLDGAPSAGQEEDETTKQLREHEAKTRGLEETIVSLERELEELETGVSATSTKENLSDALQEVNTKTVEKMVVTESVKVVHEVRSVDGTVTNGVHQLSSSEVDELLHKADEVTMGESSKTTPRLERGQAEKEEKHEKDVTPAEASSTPIMEITGVEAKPAAPQTEVSGASAENPVTMVFMGYQSVEDEDETKKVLGMESTTVKAEVVLIEDGEGKNAGSDTKQEQAPPNGSPAEADKAEEAARESEQPEGDNAEVKSKEKQPCKCCTIL
ncbi:paralemmin 1a [Danio rerio]|uniref:Paralemmin-1 n=1 Tax=Danio rerio TaxID=7955 RepID=Q568R7_DANRE|nr:paralemmin 1a [Danio rerio]AAH92750.1 Paralemmin [Danio rerio]|eukprot:NP_001017859.1 paralemmin-1 [Danio rerio]